MNMMRTAMLIAFMTAMFMSIGYLIGRKRMKILRRNITVSYANYQTVPVYRSQKSILSMKTSRMLLRPAVILKTLLLRLRPACCSA